MLRSPAWRALSLSARRVLNRIEIEVGEHGGTDNGKLPAYDDFVLYGIHRHAVGPAIREAVALGFTEITERGRAGNAEWRWPNLFRLTYRPTHNAGPTDDWKKIETARKQNPWQVRHGRHHLKKQNPSGGKRQIRVLETGTETAHSIVRKPPLLLTVQKPSLLSISRGGTTNLRWCREPG
jgi:hypothetical protein